MKVFLGFEYSCSVNYDYRVALYGINKFCEITQNVEEADIILFPSTCSGTLDRIVFGMHYMDEILAKKKDGAIAIVSGCITREFTDREVNNTIKQYLNDRFDYIIPENQITKLINGLAKKGTILEEDFSGACIQYNEKSDIFISRGCNNSCSFCKTTYQNIPLKSANLNTIKHMLDNLSTDYLNITGMNICQYGMDLNMKYGLKEILTYIEGLKEIKKVGLIGFAYKDAIQNHFDEWLDDIFKVDIIFGSLESGSDKILKLMNKGFTTNELLNFIYNIQKHQKRKFCMDIISGFPTETYDDIKATVDILKQINPYIVNVHKYDDSFLIPSHNLSQLEKKELDEHHKTYLKLLRSNKINFDAVEN